MQIDLFYKKFSVGLNLSEPITEIHNFCVRNHNYLNSIYFSLPLGTQFYSRKALSLEYENNEKKLLDVLNFISQLGIKKELALNTYHLNQTDLENAAIFCADNGIIPDEIVCLREYADELSKAFPKSELKFSFNNTFTDNIKIEPPFETLVAGKGFLRDIRKRHEVIHRGFMLTLLLNNGCLLWCRTSCGGAHCHRLFESAIKKYGLNYVYALCSFFPSELKHIIETDEESNRYKYKISNRPLGLNYTQTVIESYMSLEDDYDLLHNDYHNLNLFCVAGALSKYLSDIDIFEVKKIKENIKEEVPKSLILN